MDPVNKKKFVIVTMITGLQFGMEQTQEELQEILKANWLTLNGNLLGFQGTAPETINLNTDMIVQIDVYAEKPEVKKPNIFVPSRGNV